MEITEATEIINEGILLIPQSYKIVEKKETRVLIKTLDECRTIWNAWTVMSYPLQEDIIEEATMIQMLNAQIYKKFRRCYRYYHRHFGLTFEDVGADRKAMEDNIADICEAIRSWED